MPPDERESARTVFLAWERLRLIFNAVLTITVLALGSSFLADRACWRPLVYGAILVNICFCMGPVGEGYLSLIGIERRIGRWAVFVIGTLFGCFVVFTALYSWGMKDF